MTQPRTKPPSSNQEPDKKEGEDQVTTDTKPEVNTDFPKTVGDRTFQTPAELAEYASNLRNQLKEVGPIVKATKPGRPVSQKKQISTAVATFLNSEMTDELRVAIAKVEGDFILRLSMTDGVFSMPVAATRGEGSGGNRGGRAINVDGVDFPSAKNARDILHPDMKNKSQNYDAIVKYLENEKHKVITTPA